MLTGGRALLIAALLAALVAHVGGWVYENRLAHCASSGFCGMKTFAYDLPGDLRASLLSTETLAGAKRVDVAGWKAGRTATTNNIGPDVLQWYVDFAEPLSALIGVRVVPTPLHLPTSCCLLIYDAPGDHIFWHFDVNHYAGRYFTVLLPLTADPSNCTRFLYMDAAGEQRSLQLSHGAGVVLEGERLFHSASPQCPGGTRVILSLTYCTDPSTSVVNSVLRGLKDRAFTGAS